MREGKKEEKNIYSPGSNLVWIFQKILAVTPSVFLALLLSIPVSVGLRYGAIVLPSLVVAVVTAGSSPEEAAWCVGPVMLFLLAGECLKMFLATLREAKWGKLSCQVKYELDRKSMSCFYQLYERHSIRELKERAEASTQMWDGVYPLLDLPQQFTVLCENILCYLLFGTVIFFASPWLIVLLTLTPLTGWFCNRLYQNWEHRSRVERNDLEHRLNYVHGSTSDFQAAKEIRIYGMAGWFRDICKSLEKELYRWSRKLVVRHTAAASGGLLTILLRDGIAYAVLITMALKGELTADQFVLYTAAIASFAGSVSNITEAWSSLRGRSLNVCDLRAFLELPDGDNVGFAAQDGQNPEGDGHAGGSYAEETHAYSAEKILSSGQVPEITFDRVCFRYEGAEEDTLSDISFCLHAGEKIALVGPNGAGKTTLVKLLCGLYVPSSGEIRINDIPIQRFSRKEYYKLFSAVFQHVKGGFFSLAQMVSCQSEEKTDMDRVLTCVELAGLSEKIESLPEGILTKLDKQVNPDGTELSGGQMQKLMLARALYKDGPVLVLDEPTAALDPIAESEIYQNYRDMTVGKSSLFLSHRLASTRFCDRILFLDHGRITEEGTHEQLLAAGGEYSRLYDIQSCWYKANKV